MAGPESSSLPGAPPGEEALGLLGLDGLLARLWSPSYRRALGWAAALLVLTYGFAMTNFTLAGDDWFAVFPQSTLDTHYSLAAGRWLMPVAWAAAGGGAFAPFFTFALAVVLLTLAGLVASATWGFRRTRPGTTGTT